MKYKCIVFDCDGILVDSLPLSNKVMLQLIEPFGISKQFEKIIENYNGGSIKESLSKIEELYGQKLPNDFLQKYRILCHQTFKKELKPVDGITQLLEKIDLPICVASSGPIQKINANLETTHLLKYFGNHIFSSYQINSWKPEPGIFLHAAKEMGFLPSECLVIEDSMDGIIAAKRGGFNVVGLASEKYYENFKKTGAIVIRSLFELNSIIGLANADDVQVKKWKIIEEKDVSPSKWFPIKQHKIELPNGTIIEDYFITTLGNVGMILPITKDNKVILVKQYKHGVKEVLIELPAGFQQNNKTVEESALAELEEETGIKTTLDNLKPLGKISNTPTKSTHITYGYLATDLVFNSTQNLEVTEDLEIIQRSPIETIEMIKMEKFG